MQRVHRLVCNHGYLLDSPRELGGNLELSKTERRYLWGLTHHCLEFNGGL